MQPLPHTFRRELRTIVTADVLRHTALNEQIRQSLQHIFAAESSRHIDRQALPRELIDDRQRAKRATIVRV